MNIGVIELRNYLLKPGMREAFFHHFNDHFIDSQEVLGAYVLGQYGVTGQEDRFYWLRGFENMKSRSHFLPTFYGGRIWEEYGPAANEMMLEWQDVYLLRPAAGQSVDISLFEQWKGLLSIQHYRCGDKLPVLQSLFSKEAVSIDQATVSPWRSEMEPNDFPRLPVFQYDDQLTVISAFKDEDDRQVKEKHLHDIHQQADRLTENKLSLKLFSLAY